jgi:hypothetical protein
LTIIVDLKIADVNDKKMELSRSVRSRNIRQRRRSGQRVRKAFGTRKTAPAPRLRIENRTVSLDHPARLVGQLLLQNALGTLDSSFTAGLVQQLARATQREGKVDELDLDFMLSFIKGIEPRDKIESTLAAQMAAVRMEMMGFALRLGRIETIPQQDSAARAFNQLARTFAAQVEALKRYRSGGEQKGTVQHVSVSEGGQAIVGNVTQNPRETAPIAAPPAFDQSQKPIMKKMAEEAPAAVPLKHKLSK